MLIKDITDYLEGFAPTAYQESYDNSGLLIGSKMQPLKGVIISLDVTEAVIDEAIKKGANMIVAHHPLIFKGLKRINDQHWIDRCVQKAIKNDVAIYAIHTNLDNMRYGVNHKIAERIGLKDVQILSPKANTLCKLVTFVPEENSEEVLNALYEAGAGSVGNYDQCSFQTSGQGTFRPNEIANPYKGKVGEIEKVEELRIEVIFPTHLERSLISALKENHPYEEVAYYITSLNNSNQEIGSGMIGSLPIPMDLMDFLTSLKEKMQTACVRYTPTQHSLVSKIALCGGSGSFLLSTAINQGADLYITGDFKYHEFFEADDKIVIADIGHYESEQFTKDLLFDILSKKFANIALRLTEVETNPIKYL